MKRISVVVIMVIILGLAGASMTEASDAGAELAYVVDEAGLLTAIQVDRLDRKARQITEEYACEVRIITVRSIGRRSPMQVTDSLYTDHAFGYGPDRSCVLLFLSIEDRDFDLGVWGFGHTAFTEHGKDVILDRHILPLLKTDSFYEAFSVYLDKTEEFLALAVNGTPFDVDTDPYMIARAAMLNLIARLGIIIILPMLLAAYICAHWEKKMKTAVIARTACNYVPVDGFVLSGREDVFINKTVSRVRIVQTESSNRSSSSSSSRTSSSGGSHRSGKF